MRMRDYGTAVLTVGGLFGASLALGLATAAPAHALDPVNPVRIDLDGHPANSGFLVFVEGDVNLNSDESEGTIAAGGDLSLRTTYNIAAGASPAFPTFTAPGDNRDTYLYVGGGTTWGVPSMTVNVENGGFTKIADTGTYDAYDTDTNGAAVNYRIVPEGAGYASNQIVQGRSRQSPDSIETPVPDDLIDIAGAFAQYRTLTTEMAGCQNTVTLDDARGDPITRPVGPGDQAYVELVPGQTNVLELTTGELGDLSSLTFRDPPTANTPLLVNVIGGIYTGNIPNLAGVSGSQAPYMLWNFPQASSIVVTGGATIEGTIYAPNASLEWRPTLNIEGNVIATEFSHGLLGRLGSPREIHDFPFNANLSCDAGARLTLAKEVVNDDGGTASAADWILSADGPTPISGTTGSPEVTLADVEPGDYELSEDGPDGYDTDDWTCVGGSYSDGVVTVDEGATVVCRIVNDDVATASPSPSASPSPTDTPTPSSSVTPSVTPSVSPTVAPSATAEPSTGAGTLPDTGGPVAGWLALGLALIALGAGLVGWVRLRRQDRAT